MDLDEAGRAREVPAYIDALKNQSFVTAYIDVFAGTGYRTMSRERRGRALRELALPRYDYRDRPLAAVPARGVSRLLTRSGEIPKGWRTRLDKLLEHEADVFGNDEERVVKATNETIGTLTTG